MKPPARLRRDEWDYRTAQHLLNRAGFGGTPAEVRGLTDMGLDGAVDYIVDFDGIETEPVRADAFDPDIMFPLSRDDRSRQRDARAMRRPCRNFAAAARRPSTPIGGRCATSSTGGWPA